ncbi:GNAT family N-acetyltransferase [Streptomyces sp. NPDC093225]|uniref:GNAT family N-acetyltransferase n=1 Tax=Streptomyces sp. NPDC093225 TaxID=3366034 RepID=UPI0037FF2070
MTHARTGPPALARVSDPDLVGAELRRELVDCWVAVTNAGGAAGFPFPPVSADEVGPVADGIIGGLAPGRGHLVTATVGGELAGWVLLRRDPYRLVGHWGTVHHLQTRPAHRGRGIGTALMTELRTLARDELGLEQLRLAARGGEGLEPFYERLGWREAGRWPAALRLAPDDTRDEVLMLLDPL